jgi:hypothetical protein
MAAGLPAQDKSVRPLEVGRRVALVLGNSSYQRLGAIPAASADADDVATTLRGVGFQVIVRKDVSLRQMTSALSEFRSGIRAGDLALFYYSGHGGQAGESNYLLPVDFEPVDDEGMLPRAAYPMAEIRDLMENAGARVRLLVFDACRTSSLVNGKGNGLGLRSMEGRPEGTLVAYASAHNQIARFESGARNSLYTTELLEALRQPGHLKELLEVAQRRVFDRTGGKQTPYLYGFLSGNLFLRDMAPPPPAAAPVASAPAQTATPQPERPVLPESPAQKSSPAWKDRAEYDLVDSVTKAADAPARQIELLDQWAQQYPQSDFRALGLQLRVIAAQKLGRQDDLWNSARELFLLNPGVPAGSYFVAGTAPLRNDTSPETLALARRAALATLTQSALGADGVAAMRSTLGWVAAQEKRYEAAEAEYGACVTADARQAMCSYRLGEAILRQRNPGQQSAALFHFARAAVLEGAGSLPADARQKASDYIKRAYSGYHGSQEGLDALLAAAKAQPFPPSGFRISTVSQETAPAADPAIELWRSIRRALTGADGQAYFNASVKDALVPGGANGVGRFPATVIGVETAGKETILRVSVDGGSETDGRLSLGTSRFRPTPGTKIEFAGIVTGFSGQPYKLELRVSEVRDR